jgi:hypothetical protein
MLHRLCWDMHCAGGLCGRYYVTQGCGLADVGDLLMLGLADVADLLTLRTCWRWGLTNVGDLLMLGNCWCCELADVGDLLILRTCWRCGLADVGDLLMLGTCWCWGLADVADLLMLGTCWCCGLADVGDLLMLRTYWCCGLTDVVMFYLSQWPRWYTCDPTGPPGRHCILVRWRRVTEVNSGPLPCGTVCELHEIENPISLHEPRLELGTVRKGHDLTRSALRYLLFLC